MRVLVACEFSGVIRDAFLARGCDAWSCDLRAGEPSHDRHIQADVLEILEDRWDLMIAHPPCTYLSSSGLHHNKRNPDRRVKTEEAVKFARKFFEARIPMKCIENPVGCLSTRIREPDQFIQPHQYGHDASKETCLWLWRLPRLVPTKHIAPRWCLSKDGRRYLPRWANQTDSGQNRLGPSENREKIRSLTYQGWADAMADQWGVFA